MTRRTNAEKRQKEDREKRRTGEEKKIPGRVMRPRIFFLFCRGFQALCGIC